MHRGVNTRQGEDEMTIFQQVSNFVDAMRLEADKAGSQANTMGGQA